MTIELFVCGSMAQD